MRKRDIFFFGIVYKEPILRKKMSREVDGVSNANPRRRNVFR